MSVFIADTSSQRGFSGNKLTKLLHGLDFSFGVARQPGSSNVLYGELVFICIYNNKLHGIRFGKNEKSGISAACFEMGRRLQVKP